MVIQFANQFVALKNEFTTWKAQISKLDNRITNLERHCNILPPMDTTIKPSIKLNKNTLPSNIIPPTPSTSSSSTTPPSSTTVDPNRIGQFEGNLSAMGNQLNDISKLLQSIMGSQDAPATNQQPFPHD